MKLVKKTLFWLGLILILPKGLVFSQPGVDINIPPRLIEELGLSKKQKQKLEKLRLNMEKENIRIQAELKIKRLELRTLIDEEKPNVKEINKKIQEMGKLRTQLLKNKVKSILKLKKILTSEQEEKLKAMRRQFKKQRPPKFKSRSGKKHSPNDFGEDLP